jgi:hypothetical protein
MADNCKLPHVFFGEVTAWRVLARGQAPVPIELKRLRDTDIEYVPASELEAVAREHLRLVHQMQEVHCALGALSSSLGNGIGDESTTFGELAARIRDGVDRIVRVESQQKEAAQKRIAELELALEYTGRERDGSYAQCWGLKRDIEALGYRIKDLESLLTEKPADAK